MFSYDTQGGRAYLVYCLEESDKLSNVTLNMMQNNAFQYLADISFYQIDEKSYARYDVTSKVPAKDLFGHDVNKKILLSYMQSIVKAVQEADDHMLDARCLCLEAERIYVDVDDGKAVVICLPLDREGEPQPDFQRYFKDLLYSCTFSTNEDSSYFIKINNYLNSVAFSLDDFEKLLEDLQDKKTPAARPHAGGTPGSAGGGSGTPVSVPPVTPPPQTPPSQGGRVNYPPISPGPAAPIYGPPPVKRPSVYPVQTPPATPNKPVPPGPKAPAVPIDQQDSSEPKMSWFYLMQNYSKENAAIYKQQKAKEKAAAAMAAAAPPAKKKEKPEKKKPEKKKSKEKPPVGGIAIPGQSGIPARPGQPVPQAPRPGAYPNPQAGYAPARPAGPGPAQQPGTYPNRPACPAPAQQPGTYPNRPAGPAPAQQPGAYPARPAAQYAPAPAVPGTVILDAMENEGTIILDDPEGVTREPKGVLIHKKTRMQVVIDKDEFRLGRNPNYADYTVSGGGAVSSAHAKIIRRNGEFYVVDTNSSNHTYINGSMIPSMVEKPLKAGDRLRLANEEFEFTLQ